MRTGTFLGICGFVAGILVLFFQIFLAWIGLRIPYIDFLIFKVIEFVIFAPIVAVILFPINQRVRLWRKSRGRDIEAEEKYESKSGFISLTEK